MAGNQRINHCKQIATAFCLQRLSMPSDEHQRRSPNCAFFMVEQPTKPKATKGRKGRVSKASRMSTQSNVTITTEDQPMLDATIDEGTSALSTATDATMASNTSKARKAGRPKKAKAKGRGKALKSKEEEPQISSFMEPEDDNFEVKVPAPPSRTTRGKKRTSEEMETNSVLQDEIQPPTKRRATRTRSGTVKPQTEPGSLDHEKDTTDVQMADAEEVPPAPVSKKGGKGAKKRGSSSVRKASNLSTASKASLRAAIPADEEIEAALEADLDRPLTDDEAQEPIDEQKPQTCRLTRTKQSSRKGPALASIASVRMAARASAESQKELSLHAMDHVATKEKEPSVLDDTQDQRPTKSANGRKVKKDSTAEPAYETATELQNQSIDYELSNAMDVDDMVNHETTHALPRVQVVVEVQSTARESSGTIGTVQAVKEQIAKPKGTKGRPKGKKNSKIEQESQVDDESPVEANVQSPHAPTTQSEPLPIDNSPQVQAQPPPTPQNQIPSPTPSPQSSDAENHPPSSRPSQTRPPPPQLSPLQSRTTRVPLAASTPNTSPSKRNVARLETTYPWSAVDLDYIFLNSPNVDKENADLADLKNVLTSPEKKMTVEEWIKYNARNAEEKLKAECERTVGKFESEGVRALKALEGIVCLE